MKHYMCVVLSVLGLLLTASVHITGQSSANVQAPVFRVDPAWPMIPNNWVFGEVSSIAVDSQDHVWMIHRPNTVPADQRAKAAPPVLEFDGAGKLITSWGGPGAGYDWPEREHGIYVDPANFVWIGGNNGYGTPLPPGDSDDMLLKFTTAGKFVLQIGHRNSSAGNADTRNLHQPADSFLNRATNEIFVADGYGNQRVIVFDAGTGAFKRMWGAFGNKPETPPPAAGGTVPADGPPQFGLVHSIKISADGMVYVADRANHRIQVFTIDGKYITQKLIGTMGQTAAGLAFSPDGGQRFLYVANLADSQIVVLDRKTLDVVTTFGRPGSAPGEFGTLHHLAADSKGNIYTAEIGRNRRAQKLVLTTASRSR
jgi:DNA-binding beta-propeller fold protein YncE